MRNVIDMVKDAVYFVFMTSFYLCIAGFVVCGYLGVMLLLFKGLLYLWS